MRCTSLRLLAFLAVLATLSSAAFAQTCTKNDIAAVIDGTGASLRAVNGRHQPVLQTKLRQLGEQRGWSDAERDSKSAEFLQDDETRALDEQASQLLVELDQLGDDGANAQRSCAERLAQLKTVSAQIIEVTTAKAAHVTAKLDAALKAQSSRAVAQQPAPPKAQPKTAANIEPRPAPSAPPVRAPAPSAEKRAPAPPAGESRDGRPASAWETDTVHNIAPGDTLPPLPPPRVITDLPPRLQQSEDLEFTSEDIRNAGRGFFGSISAGLASAIEYTFQTYGRPNGYILGSEGGAALLAGLRYGDGRLVTKLGGEKQVYWQGPSVGSDLGLAGSRVMFLVYNLRDDQDLFARFIGVDGSAYLVGGVGVTFLKKGNVILAPIRTGLGLRVGASVGYLKFTPEPSLNPF